jgi:hypothetical protein
MPTPNHQANRVRYDVPVEMPEDLAFQAGPPVYGERFFGRRHLLDTMRALALTGTSVLLVGERRIGKSSLLLQLEHLSRVNRDHSAPTDPIRIMARTYDVDEASAVVEVARQIAKCPDLNPGLRKELEPFVEGKLGISEFLHFLRSLRERNYQVTLLYDDINDRIRDSGRLGLLLRLVATEGHIVIIASSFVVINVLQERSGIDSPWPNFFRTQYVSLLSREDSIDLLKTNSEKSGRPFHDAEITFLINVFGDYPYELQLAGVNAFTHVDFARVPRAKRAERLVDAAQRSIEDLYEYWDSRMRSRSDSEAGALIQVARGELTPNTRAVRDLINRGLLVDGPKGPELYGAAFREFLLSAAGDYSIDPSATPPGTGRIWTNLRGLLRPAWDEAVKKAVEVAAKRFLG